MFLLENEYTELTLSFQDGAFLRLYMDQYFSQMSFFFSCITTPKPTPTPTPTTTHTNTPTTFSSARPTTITSFPLPTTATIATAKPSLL